MVATGTIPITDTATPIHVTDTATATGITQVTVTDTAATIQVTDMGTDTIRVGGIATHGGLGDATGISWPRRSTVPKDRISGLTANGRGMQLLAAGEI
jgi:hypothetical protein